MLGQFSLYICGMWDAENIFAQCSVNAKWID